MTPERWKRVQEIYAAAAERPSEARVLYLDEACRDDTEIRMEVESLLASHEAASPGFLESPAIEATEAMTTPPPIVRRSLAPGTRLGAFEILAPIGAGGMGEVYRARDSRLQREVAIKVLSPSFAGDAELLARFEREALAVAALSHPNILSIFDFGSDKGVTYAVMELLEGQTLRASLTVGPISEAEILDYTLQITRGLAIAHEKEIVHRDLKPENLFLTRDGRIKILDFGLAKKVPAVVAGKETSAPTMTGHTTPGMVMGTLGYMSPEQLLGLPIDHRTDLFSLGVVLYEMTTGQLPFKGNSAVAIADAILHGEPRDFGDKPIAGKLKLLIRRLLEKDPAKRYASADEVHAEIKVLQASLVPVPSTISREIRIAAGAALAVIIALGFWQWHRSSRERWARAIATPEIAKLIADGNSSEAVALAREARAVLPTDPGLETLWMKATGEVSLETDPSGAEVEIRPYVGIPDVWQQLGPTPLKKLRLPNGALVVRIKRQGFAGMTFLEEPPFEYKLKLTPAANVPEGMVPVHGDDSRLGWPLAETQAVRLDDFLIDRHEVTNEEFKRFVDQGGYQKPQFWKQPFLKDGRTISLEEAISLFRDSTGQPGPATWEVGSFPKGKEKHPVAGVSWYEAAAYAEFAGKSLPTIYHWNLAAETYFQALVVAGSNFHGAGTQAVGAPNALSGFGTTDMAGNVAEWCWNESWSDKRFLLGGGFGDPTYCFAQSLAQSPWNRRPNTGFRCVKLSAPASAEAGARMEPILRDYSKETPVPDEVFAAFKGLYAYDKGPLDSKIEDTATAEGWKREKVSFNAAYGGERVTAYIFLPTNATPPFQTVVYYPGGGAFLTPTFDPAIIDEYDYVPRSGRAMVFPIYRGQYERTDGLGVGGQPPAKWRDRVIMQSKDLGRTFDYLETRADIDNARCAYFGFSAGAAISPLLLANEPRIRAAILSSGGFWFRHPLPVVDWINFVTRVKIPVLMLNGRLDDFFPVESAQLPLFRRFGTPDKDKKFVLYEGGTHGNLPHKEEIRETLGWLDRYLGPVKR